MATETLSELLIRFRTDGEREAKAAIARTVADAQKQQAALTSAQKAAEERRRNDRLKFLQAEAADASKSEKDKIAAQKALANHLLVEQKAHDRARVAQEKSVQRELAATIKNGQRELKKIEDKRAADAKGAGEAGRASFASGGRRFGDAVVGGAINFGKAAAIGGAGLATGGALAFKDFLDDADKLKSVAAFTSMTVSRLQELSFAFEQNGTSAETFADGIRQFNAGVRESAKGGGKTGAVVEGLDDMGISFKKLLDMSPEEQFFTILKRANELGPSMARAGAFAKIFGETAGASFARIADTGVSSIEAAAKSAKDLGFVLDRSIVDQAVRVKQQLGATMSVIGGLKDSILSALLPSAEKYIGIVRDWIVANRQLIKTSVVEWLGKLEAAAKSAWPDVQKLVKLMVEFLPTLVKWGPTLLEIGLAMKGLNLAKDAASSIKTLAGAFTTAQGSAAAFAGAGGIGAIVQALLIALPIAKEFGEYLGDIGNQNTGPRSTLTQKMLAASIDAFGVAGGEAYAEELAGMNDADLAKIESEVMNSERAKDIRARGKLENIFIKARQRKDDLSMNNTDVLRSELLKDIGNRKKYSLKDLESLRDQGQISQEEFDLARGSRNSGAFNKARKSEKEDDKLSDAELLKLIDKAVQSGANLQDLIGQRKLAGTTPPVITITQHITNVTATATMNVKGAAGQSEERLGMIVVEKFNNWLSDRVRESLPQSGIAR